MNSLQKGKRQVCISVFHIFGASLGVEGSGVWGGGVGLAHRPLVLEHVILTRDVRQRTNMNGQKIGTEKNSYKTKRNVTGPYTKVNLCFYYVGMITIVWFQKISIPPPHGRDLPYDPPPLWIFQNRPSKFTPPPLRNFQNFRTPPGNFAISN